MSNTYKIVKDINTGKYFDGSGFRVDKEQALHFPPHMTELYFKYSYEQIIARDKTSLDIFWLKDKSLADLDNLPEPDILASEIIESLEAGLNSFREIAVAL